MAEQSRVEFEQKLADKATSDPDFRVKLIAAPKKAITELLGLELPDGMNVAVHEEDADTLHFILPPAGDELSAAELTGVSGGACWSDCSCEDYMAIP